MKFFPGDKEHVEEKAKGSPKSLIYMSTTQTHSSRAFRHGQEPCEPQPSLHILEGNSESIFHPKLRQWYLLWIKLHIEECLKLCLYFLDSFFYEQHSSSKPSYDSPLKASNSNKELNEDHEYYPQHLTMKWKIHTNSKWRKSKNTACQ